MTTIDTTTASATPLLNSARARALLLEEGLDGIVTATRSVVTGATSLGIASPVLRALSRKHRIASLAISRASSKVSP